jgi:hypothetical protein
VYTKILTNTHYFFPPNAVDLASGQEVYEVSNTWKPIISKDAKAGSLLILMVRGSKFPN